VLQQQTATRHCKQTLQQHTMYLPQHRCVDTARHNTGQHSQMSDVLLQYIVAACLVCCCSVFLHSVSAQRWAPFSNVRCVVAIYCCSVSRVLLQCFFAQCLGTTLGNILKCQMCCCSVLLPCVSCVVAVYCCSVSRHNARQHSHQCNCGSQIGSCIAMRRPHLCCCLCEIRNQSCHV